MWASGGSSTIAPIEVPEVVAGWAKGGCVVLAPEDALRSRRCPLLKVGTFGGVGHLRERPDPSAVKTILLGLNSKGLASRSERLGGNAGICRFAPHILGRFPGPVGQLAPKEVHALLFSGPAFIIGCMFR